jgi:hypothetical protein
MSCVAQNHSIYCDTALRFLTTVAKVKDSTGCCAECLKYQPVGVGGGGQPCNIWTFCGPSGSCTLSGEGVARPAHWTNMAVGDCVLLYWPVASTGQPSISGPIAQRLLRTCRTGQVRGLHSLCCETTRPVPKKSASLQSDT